MLARQQRITAEDVAEAIGAGAAPAPSAVPEAALDAPDLRDARRLFEIAYITRKLREHGGNVTRTAAAIGLERQSLQEKIKQLGISRTG